jgi:hypothetical protein
VGKLAALISSVLALVALVALPGSVLATGGYDCGVVHDYCGGTYNRTAFYKVREIAAGTTSANKLTIDSSIQARDPGHPHWYTLYTWPRVSTTFTPDGTYHRLSLARKAAGGVDVQVRLVIKLKA